jgi:3-oxoacyl-[acyl-carrier protein] reductase
MELGLAGRTALVLGSTSGLGLAIAQGLAREGARVAICGRRAEVATARAAELPGAIGIEADLSAPDAAAATAQSVQEGLGKVDILVLNAGGPRPGPAAELTAKGLAPALDTLLLTQIDFVSLLLPGMRQRGWGRILAIGSSGIIQPIPDLVRSNTARAALAGYLKTLANEVAHDGVTVNMILPGRIDTDRVAALDRHAATARGIDEAQVRRASETRIPVGRYGTTDEFASVGVFLCSTAASYVTGSAIRVDGGLIGSQ